MDRVRSDARECRGVKNHRYSRATVRSAGGWPRLVLRTEHSFILDEIAHDDVLSSWDESTASSQVGNER